MTTNWKRVCLTVLATAVLWPAAASAQWERVMAMQGAGHPAISATGSSIVQRKATQLRVYMQLTAKGKTLQDALAKLKEHQEAARTQLEALKADGKSIVFGAATVSNDQSSRKKQIQAMMIQQMRARGKKVPKGLAAPPSVTIACTLTAQWPLKEESHDKLLLLSQRIQDKIKAADLSGSKEAEKASAEEEESEEEANQMMANQYGEDPQQANQPQFLFVAQLAKADRQKAMAEAFVKAKAQAAELAKAAAVELGPLVGLSGACAGQSTVNENPYYSRYSSGNQSIVAQMIAEQAGDSSGDKEEKPDEAMGADPSSLKFNCTVAATFQMGK